MKVLKKTLPQYHHNLISQEGEIKLIQRIQNPRNCFDVYAGLARERVNIVEVRRIVKLLTHKCKYC